MGNSKEKRIKKLKRNRLWPYITGLFLLLFIFVTVLFAALGSSAVGIVQSNLIDSCAQSEKVAAAFTDYSPETKEKIQQNILSNIDILKEVEAVSVRDKDKNPIWSSSGEYPSTDNAVGTDFLLGDEYKNYSIVITEEEEQLFTFSDDEININTNYFNEHVFSINDLFDITGTFANTKLWFVIPVNDLEVMILNNITLYHQDFIMMITSVMLCAVIIAVFVIYYLFSVISMILGVRRTTKVIYTDMITGGDNQLSFIRNGTKLLKKNRYGQQNYAALHLEMRKYSSFCTCFGVNKGQELIEDFYKVLRKEIHKKEALSHQENAAFSLLLTYTDKNELEARVAKMRDSLNKVLPEMKMYFNTGIYEVPPNEIDIEQYYNNAMIACEMSGDESENSIAYFDIEMNKQKLWERKVENDMERALANREFQVYLQPKISTSEEKLGGAEALVRWIHPTEGFIPPNRFIPIFEKNGFILKLDDYMLEEIARVQSEWLAAGRTLVPISVNVSRAHFTREDLAEHICAVVDKYNVPHSVIELELTESAFFDDKNVLLNTVQKLRKAGFKVSMDDFGAGYSSLNSLKELQIDVLKIDADFFRGADAEERGLLIVSEVIDLAKKLNMKIVAEGIESREQVEFLTEQECDLIQGYFYAKPMPVPEFAQKYEM